MLTRKLGGIIVAAGLSALLVACGNDAGEAADAPTDRTTGAAPAPAATVELPTAGQLNEVLTTAANPELPIEERRRTVEGGEGVDQSVFDALTASQQESGAQLQVVDPVLPGYSPNSVLAVVSITAPDREPTTADKVEFIWEDNTWKIGKSWACVLVENTLPPEQVPPTCVAEDGASETPQM
ncbi:hypothetical protein [Corynebacterium uterequi]|uniref:Low molecular weight antigen MTB12-like C-terminal domain-containing protein n=1 Tax=Corynebacterium uterequi TaxID=1072256 RepID=A0A0G3HDQ6_9CORY|nr:hypothetical protein [Corynebacterium uterequi]AKK11444.1 hypothetical protein CUTER_07275 [Corynebacterium uterequi]